MRLYLTPVLLAVLLVSCIPAAPFPIPASTNLPPFTPAPTVAATSIEPPITIPSDDPGNSVMDFVASICEATWSNNSQYLTCPGNLAELPKGYVDYSDQTVIEGNIPVNAPVLIGSPGQGGDNGTGLFGHYPAFTVQAGDRFKAWVACQVDIPCNVEFALEYFDANKTYQKDTGWKWQHKAGDGPFEIDLDLTPLAGQTVEFLLVVREQDSSQGAWVVWIAPRIIRYPEQ
jgi:hypothetical protein